MFFTFSNVSLQSEQGPPGCDFCCCRFRRDAKPDSTFAKKTFFHEMQFRRDARPDLPLLDPLGSPLDVIGSPLGPLWVPIVFADSITLLTHLASRVPFGSPWVLFGFLCFPLGSPWVPSGPPFGSPWPPKCHFYPTFLMFFLKPFILLQ